MLVADRWEDTESDSFISFSIFVQMSIFYAAMKQDIKLSFGAIIYYHDDEID